jgi:transposase
MAFKKGGIRVSERTVKYIAAEAKLQEDEPEKYYLETGEVMGMDHGSARKGNCGRKETGDGFVPIIVTQPPNSPDLNINDLGFFSSLKVDVKRICTHCTSREEMMANVMKAFEEYPREKIDGIWACWFNNLRSVMSCDGGNDYKQGAIMGVKGAKEIPVLRVISRLI